MRVSIVSGVFLALALVTTSLSAEDVSPESFYRQTLELISEGNLEAADENCFRLFMHGFYLGDEQSFELADKLRRKLAEAGHAEAQFRLASRARLEAPFGATLFDSEAELWIRRAAKQGHVQAQGELAQALILESEEMKDWSEGMMWMFVAQANGYEEGYDLLDVMKKLVTVELIERAQHRAEICRASDHQKCD